ncbi:lipocalin family protein [Pseudoflavitalea sp. G-6-1-2]|uniref:lipocalin family protein n=1 Tax=Pseudoflavitalea sp. G-6-1-2 TaxID=2728841 RepID=UPI00146B69B7|nr:lipocalin family protein [Pseudoflavitalea sp. G-6-1-2]NML23433.1 lipocalin family protein [Pseudoflavitalea sp. G-6-1-2]
MKPLNTILPAAALAAALAITAFALPAKQEQTPSFADKYWLMESGSIVPATDLNADGKPDSDLRNFLEDCEKDDTEMFRSNGKFVKNLGKQKCVEGEDAEYEDGSWTYNSATKQLTIKQNEVPQPIVISIKELTATKLVGTFEFTSPQGQKVMITGVYKLKQ